MVEVAAGVAVAPDADLIVGNWQAADMAPRYQHGSIGGLRDEAGAQQLLQLLHDALLVLVAPVEVVRHRVVYDGAVERELQ
jgi:hypothetical protein